MGRKYANAVAAISYGSRMNQASVEPIVRSRLFPFKDHTFFIGLVKPMKVLICVLFTALPELHLAKHLVPMFFLQLVEIHFRIYIGILRGFEKGNVLAVLVIIQASDAQNRICH